MDEIMINFNEENKKIKTPKTFNELDNFTENLVANKNSQYIYFYKEKNNNSEKEIKDSKSYEEFLNILNDEKNITLYIKLIQDNKNILELDNEISNLKELILKQSEENKKLN